MTFELKQEFLPIKREINKSLLTIDYSVIDTEGLAVISFFRIFASIMKKRIYILIVFITCSVTALFSQKPFTDTPKRGEGLGVFLERNGYDLGRYKAKFIEINKDKLGPGNTLKLGEKYTFPLLIEEHPEVLFGSKHQNIQIKDKSLKGAVYYLVCGHGGPDPGAMGRLNGHDLCEDEYAYDIVLRLARQLLVRSAKVYIIIQDPDDGIRESAYLGIDDHETCLGEPIPLDHNERLRQRTKAINKLHQKHRGKYERCVFIHLDSRSKKEQIDIFLYHAKGSTKGQRLATTLQKTFRKKYNQHQPGRGFSGTVSWRNLHVLVASNPPAVFLELGNMQNSRDQQRFTKASNREAVANWIAEGLVEDYKMK